MNIDRFDNIANTWWEKNGPCKALHIINTVRFNYIINKVNIKKKHILDIGCGGGILTETLNLHKSIITGIDKSENMINIAKTHANKSKLNINYYNNTISNFKNFNDNKFDIITCMEILEHINNPNDLIYACKNLLKPNGSIFLSSLNKNLLTYLYIIIFGEYITKIIPKKTHIYNLFIKPSKLKYLINQNNLIINDIKGIIYNPILNCATLSNNITTNYIMHIINNK